MKKTILILACLIMALSVKSQSIIIRNWTSTPTTFSLLYSDCDTCHLQTMPIDVLSNRYKAFNGVELINAVFGWVGGGYPTGGGPGTWYSLFLNDPGLTISESSPTATFSGLTVTWLTEEDGTIFVNITE